MDWGGKLVGGAVGLLMGGPVGAALGVLAGHLLDDKLAESRRGGRPRNEPQRRNPPGGGPAPGPEPGAEPGSGKKKRASTVYHVEDTDPLAAGASGAAAADEAEDGPSVRNPEVVSARFFQTTFEVMGHVAKSDGRVSEDDIRAARAVMNDFALDEQQIGRAIDSFNAGKHESYNVEREVLALRRVCAGRPDLLRNFLEIQMRAAIGGSDLRGPARPLLTRVAAILGMGGLEFAQLETVLRIRYRARGNRGDAADWNRPADAAHRGPHGTQGPQGGAPGGADSTASRGSRSGERAGGASGRGGARAGHSRRAGTGTGEQRSGANNRGPSLSGARMSLQEAYQVLDVLPGARMPEITKAYRRQLSRHHPDKLQANGLPDSMLAHAQQQTQLIIEAFNIIRESRGEKA
jgi:DnaJ like chaperone protein